MKYIRLAIMGLALSAVIIGGYYLVFKQVTKTKINNFEQCASAGYPIQESQPETCRTPDGQVFEKE